MYSWYYRLRNRDWKHADNPCRHQIGENWQKITKMAKNDAIFDNISGAQARMNFKIRYPGGDGLLPATVALSSHTWSVLVPTMRPFRNGALFAILLLGPVKATRFSKSSYPSGGSPQLGRKLQFLAATSTRAETQSQNMFCTGYKGRAYRNLHCRKHRLATLSAEKRCQTAALSIESCW